jgi:predicted ATPase
VVSRVPADRIVTGRRLVGRESRLGRLRSAIERTRDERKPRLVCVTGLPGVGKSALLNGFAESPPAGILVGRANAVADAAPYGLLGALLDSLAGGVKWADEPVRERIAASVGSGADLMLDLAPHWADLLAVQANQPAERDPEAWPVTGPSLPEHLRNRLRFMLQRVFAALDEAFGCVVLVADDLHLSDRYSVEALGALLSADEAAIVLVGAYSGKDVGSGHPVKLLVEAGNRRAPSSVVTIELRPLPDTAVTELVAGMLGLFNADVQPLASVIVSGTGSNPLAVEQLLHWLAEQGLLTYDRARSTWTWQMDRINAVAPAASRIGAVIQSRLNRLSPAVRELLRLAALLGERFDTADLTRVAREQGAGAAEKLRLAVHLEFLRPLDTTGARYVWAHPMLRETILDSATAQERAAVVTALVDEADERSPRLFELLARPGIAELAPMRLAELHLAAGRIAARRGATEITSKHLRAGVEALPASAWESRYELAFRLHIEAARAARSLGDTRGADRMLDLAMVHAASDLDSAAVCRARLTLRWHRRGYGGAPHAGFAALRLLGVQLPPDDADWSGAATVALASVHARLSDVDADRPSTVDERWRMAADLIADLLTAVAVDPEFTAVLAARGVELALDHGPAPGSGYAFAWLGAAFATRFGDEVAAERCANAALALAARPGERDLHAAATKATVALALPFLVGTAQSTLALLRDAYEICLDSGDVPGAVAALLMRPYYLLAIGQPIEEVAAEAAVCARLSDEHGRNLVGQAAAASVDEAIGRLRGQLPAPAESEPPSATTRSEFGFVSSLHLTGELMAAYLLGDYARAVKLAEAAESVPMPHWAGFLTGERRFYHALAIAAHYPSAEPRERRKWTVKLNALQHELERWAEHRPAGFAHQALLVSAEQARLAGEVETALGRYERVIGGARENGFLHVQAIAAELGGKCALEHAGPADALAFLRRARACYARWGAVVKLDQLDALLAGAAATARPEHPVDQLDLLNVVKSFQTLSAVLDLDKLTATILELLVHHTGAQRGCLVLRDFTHAGAGGGLRLAAEAVNDSDFVEVTREPHGDLGTRVPLDLVERVAGGREVALLGEDDYGTDAYLLAHRPRAFLAAPIAHQGRLIGVLYLEHRHRVDAFGPGQLDGLEVLCTQAAICLDNAALYAKLADANRVLDATFERLPVGLIVLRPDLTVERASPHAVKMLGLPISHGTPLVDLIDVLTPVDIAAPMRREPALGSIVPEELVSTRREFVIIRPDGQRQRVDTWLIPLRDHSNRLLGVTLLVSTVD